MPWIILILAGLCEVAWVIGLRSSQGFTRLWPAVFTVVAMLLSFGLLTLASKSISSPLAYSVWVGIGVVGAWAIGISLYKEPFSPVQILFVSLVLVGVVGLKLTSPNAATPAPTQAPAS